MINTLDAVSNSFVNRTRTANTLLGLELGTQMVHKCILLQQIPLD